MFHYDNYSEMYIGSFNVSRSALTSGVEWNYRFSSLTATPERMDGRNIYEICDYNVPYELPLADAINKGMLVPFHYYGIYDDTDYSKLHVVKGCVVRNKKSRD